MSDALRPLTTLEILDGAALLLRRNWAAWYAISSLGTLPVALLILAYFQWTGTLVQGTEGGMLVKGTLWWGLGMSLAWALLCVSRAVVTVMALAAARGEALRRGAAWRAAGRHAAGSAFVGVVAFAAAWLAGSCLAAPGLFLALAWWAARPVLLDEERLFGAALRRSWRLTEGYRGKALVLWLLFIGIWLVGALNLHLFVKAVVGLSGSFLGRDTSAILAQLRFGNLVYPTLLFVALLVLIDPLKTVVDAVYYLDLRTRREGADLQQRLARLRTAALSAFLLALCLTGGAVRAMPLEAYRARVRSLEAQVRAARSPDGVDPLAVGDIRNQLVETDGQKITAQNEWLREDLEAWRKSGKKEALLGRLEALDRSLGGASSVAGSPAPSTETGVDPRQEVQKLLAEPEFAPLADLPSPQVDLKEPGNWWQSFWRWLRKSLLKFNLKMPLPPNPPQITAPKWPALDAALLQGLFIGILVLLLVGLAALLVRWIVTKPARAAVPRTVIAGGPAAALEASATENALDHSVDEWELFAQEWLSRGDLRQAIRSLYLATLVHLHHQRRIEYNRAFTNWVYVRHFRGEPTDQGTLRTLTQIFDDVWYGDREPAHEQYRSFEKGVRDLGTPAPAAGGSRG